MKEEIKSTVGGGVSSMCDSDERLWGLPKPLDRSSGWMTGRLWLTDWLFYPCMGPTDRSVGSERTDSRETPNHRGIELWTWNVSLFRGAPKEMKKEIDTLQWLVVVRLTMGLKEQVGGFPFLGRGSCVLVFVRAVFNPNRLVNGRPQFIEKQKKGGNDGRLADHLNRLKLTPSGTWVL